MRSVQSTVERRFESYSGSLFSAMKTEYVVVAEQAHPLGPAYSFPIQIRCRVTHGMIVDMCRHAIHYCDVISKPSCRGRAVASLQCKHMLATPLTAAILEVWLL